MIKDPIKEAKRYLKNTDKILQGHCKIDEFGNYDNNKHVKIAGNSAWKALLEALDSLHPKLKGGQRKSVDSPRDILINKAQKYLQIYNNAYNLLHLDLGYDGTAATGVKKEGWKQAKPHIDWADKNIPELQPVR